MMGTGQQNWGHFAPPIEIVHHPPLVGFHNGWKSSDSGCRVILLQTNDGASLKDVLGISFDFNAWSIGIENWLGAIDYPWHRDHMLGVASIPYQEKNIPPRLFRHAVSR